MKGNSSACQMETGYLITVSIQLASPMKGNDTALDLTTEMSASFHSISFPNEGEWLGVPQLDPAIVPCFHSISFPNEGEFLVDHIWTIENSLEFPFN